MAEELESAERYGLPMPYGVHVHVNGAEFTMRHEDQYERWCSYMEPVQVIHGGMFDHAEADVNGLRLTVSTPSRSVAS